MTRSHVRREMNRRQLLKAISVGAFGLAGVGGLSGAVDADSSSDHYHNPVYEPLFPDPTVIEADGRYYAYGSNMEKDAESQERLIPILSSTDLIDWRYEGEALGSYPDWRSDDASLWAPDITYYNGEYRIYYSYSVWGSNNNPGIGLATASTPTGPFTDQGPVFRESDIGVTNCIDAEFHLEGETPYMIWGSWNGIHGVQLTADGRDYVRGTEFQLAGDRREGAHLVRENGYYYLYYSTGHCCEGHSSDYTVEVGRSRSLTGPYHNQNGTDLRTLNEHNSGVAILSGNSRFAGPGHNTTITDEYGQRWMLYHAYDTQDSEYVDGTWRRSLMVDRIEYDSDDWPVVACDGTPSQQAPVPGNSGGCTNGISEGTYHITNVNSGKLLEVANADTTDGANVRQWEDTGHPTQNWTVIDNGDGSYRLENAHSGKALEVYEASTADGANVVQWSYWGGENQQWNIEAVGSGAYRIENINSLKVLDVYESGTQNGENVIQWSDGGRKNQQWTFTPV